MMQLCKTAQVYSVVSTNCTYNNSVIVRTPIEYTDTILTE